MKVIFIKKIKKIGEIGDIKEVSDGYAINFLIPQKIAEPASVKNVNKFRNIKQQDNKQANKALVLAQKKAKQLQGLVIKIIGKCNDDGKLYSSISADMIVDKLKDRGINIESSQINLLKPIKDLGKHSVFIVLSHGLESEITVIVNE
ncbi:50S ribosomal protein L9 [Candidatus Falkowbacteria bacterium]|uniref:Large ribosomal subunit protein bL9 n=1 Tax=Candidatus Buchananbacteria bacterium CG10_big_fil_rev_8_21_14_0_10_33_19 TaxID=1974525 RepID=A0A2H0W4B4_9BACT|nr:50S ribosomal protein L9 [Candidatus Falkowbacteria bacterium]PIS06193.1 MAG: 50S ribosomal protein L9 [Candidatus Buchananbacteria bacterium CG10_big_fil_rev_8_21_14_0_10_33_19]